MEGLFRDALLAVGLQLFGPLLQQRVDRIDAEFRQYFTTTGRATGPLAAAVTRR